MSEATNIATQKTHSTTHAIDVNQFHSNICIHQLQCNTLLQNLRVSEFQSSLMNDMSLHLSCSTSSENVTVRTETIKSSHFTNVDVCNIFCTIHILFLQKWASCQFIISWRNNGKKLYYYHLNRLKMLFYILIIVVNDMPPRIDFSARDF